MIIIPDYVTRHSPNMRKNNENQHKQRPLGKKKRRRIPRVVFLLHIERLKHPNVLLQLRLNPDQQVSGNLILVFFSYFDALP
ncbi:hypothetical protein MALU111345_05565 [Marinicrinis lubricantis]